MNSHGNLLHMSALEIAVKHVLVGSHHSEILWVDAELPTARMLAERARLVGRDIVGMIVTKLARFVGRDIARRTLTEAFGFVVETHLYDKKRERAMREREKTGYEINDRGQPGFKAPSLPCIASNHKLPQATLSCGEVI